MKKKRREFLKSSAVAVAGTAVGASWLSSCSPSGSSSGEAEASAEAAAPAGLGPIEAAALGFGFSALEPHIDAMTMEIHYGKHYQGYVRKYNAALEEAKPEASSMEDLFAKVGTLGDAGTGLRNNGGGAYNHGLFWEVLQPGGAPKPEGDLAEAIKASFGSYETLVDQFSAAAKGRFGSGWGWLVKQGDKLAVGSTPNQDNPLMDVSELQGTPILGLDVWEHAYYLHYQNRRGDYVENFWNLVNWDVVAEKWQSA